MKKIEEYPVGLTNILLFVDNLTTLNNGVNWTKVARRYPPELELRRQALQPIKACLKISLQK